MSSVGFFYYMIAPETDPADAYSMGHKPSSRNRNTDFIIKLLGYSGNHKKQTSSNPVPAPMLRNLNVGHATPRCIVPFGKMAYVDAKNQVIRFDE